MFNVHRVEADFDGKKLSIETGKIGRQASGTVVVQMGETMVLVAVTGAKLSRELPFFPLIVDYREKLSAAGKFPGGFMKREGRPTTKEILTCRLIDRPIRPLFPSGMGIEVQVMASVLSADMSVDPDMLAGVGTMAALHISDVPWDGPLGIVRVGEVDGEFVAFPTIEERADSPLDFVVAGSADAIAMVEAGADEIIEEDLLDALEFATEQNAKIVRMIEDLRKKCGKEKFTFEPPTRDEELVKAVREAFLDDMTKAVRTKEKKARGLAASAVKKAALAKFSPEVAEGEDKPADWKAPSAVEDALDELKRYVLRRGILDEGVRIDGRKTDEIRPIECEVGMLPRVHGSALFTRGETQALILLALGTSYDEQRVDGLMPEYTDRFMLHYQFPPFSVGECRPIRGPGRREIGHGMLAQRALTPVIPGPDAFPYTIKINSDITESNGSSSMASVCGGTLAMMHAGVPIKQPVAGIAMGLVVEGDKVEVLSDILGAEDKDGDMDFKCTGTHNGITALQLDCKVAGITRETMVKALEQARKGRLHILKCMLETISRPSSNISSHAPRILRTKINPDKIGLVIGPGGKQIRKIQEETGANIAIEEDGTVSIYCVNEKGAMDALHVIQGLTANPEVGRIYNGRVTSIKDFGCFVEILPNQEGLVHISELADGFVSKVGDVVTQGDYIDVKVLLIDEQGRVKLSKKAADKEAAGAEAETADAT